MKRFVKKFSFTVTTMLLAGAILVPNVFASEVLPVESRASLAYV